MRLKFQREPLESFYPEALPLMQKHHAEIDEFPDVPLQVDIEGYRERAASLRIFTARLDRGPADPLQLVGYTIFCVRRNPHNGMHQALADAVYLDPEQRKGFAGRDLLKFADAQLKTEGIEAIYHFVKMGHPALGAILARQGYLAVESVWVRRFA